MRGGSHDYSPRSTRNVWMSHGNFYNFFDVEEEAVFSQIVTGDETWIHYWIPELKRQYGEAQR